MKRWVQNLEIGIEELILGFLILIEVLDFFKIIPAPLEYVEKVLAIIAMCYLFYHASITKIVFGIREKNYDLMIVFAYLLLSVKTLIGFIITAAQEKSLMQEFYILILQNADLIEKICFWIGGLILISLAGLLVHENVKKSSLMHIIHEQKKAGDWKHKTIRFFTIYLVLLSLYVIVFTFAIEWLAITVDAPILMIFLFFYLAVIVKRGRAMNTESFLKKVSESSEGFYEKFISLFHSRKTIMLAITGLLVLHLLVEIGHFIIPYTTGLMYPWYFEQLGPGHEPLATHLTADFAMASNLGMQIGTMIIYLLNVLIVLMLFFGPAYLWAHMYQKKKEHIPNIAWIFFAGLSAFILQPVFKIKQTQSTTLIGADIITHQVPLLSNVWYALLIAAIVGSIFYILSKKNHVKTIQTLFVVVLIYFAIYLYHFFLNLTKYYIHAITTMAHNGHYFIAGHLFLFFVITIMFYVCAYATFLWQTAIMKSY